ncbi:hypothetical protein C8046_09400 [Serinibacter arcticus]|uniref:N-Acetyl-D-glucosamine ABC transport system, sugar-binding protein n=1 Tax=Serinibacter arcticus TaxID=1655435 RepID=A0A2U1ZV41_9MICO|nr:sugar ABC transporter substrate-binding protein [Serinibacter arcticus]PWD50831.1 hypothetical protein C8046_09400 [Serinibacter arcticus]
MRRNRGAAVVAGAFALTLVLASCQQGSSTAGDSESPADGEDTTSADGGGSGETVNLTFQSLAGQEATIAETERLVDEWNTANPDIQVEIVPAAWDGVYDKLVTQFTGGSAPDIIHFEAAGIRPFAVDGYIADLTDLISEDLRSGISEGVWESVTVDDAIIGYPTMMQSYMVFANTDLLEAAGVEIPTGDTMTWEELREIARATTKDGVYGLGWGLKNPTATVMSLGLGNDGTFFSGEGTEAEIEVGDAELAVPTQMHEMAYTDMSLQPVSLTQSGGEVLPSFYGGQVAMTVQGSFQATNIAADAPEGFNWTVLPPLEGSASAAQSANPQTLSVNVDSEHVEESAQFIEFLMQPENLAALNYADALIPTSEQAREALATTTEGLTGWDQILASGDNLTAPAFLKVDLYQQWNETVATPALQRYLAGEIDVDALKAEMTDGWAQVNR